jgi:hypothetical protein
MPFWSSGKVEPKRQFRFQVSIGGLAGGGQFYAKSVTKPSFNVTTADHRFLNHTFYYPGAVQWNTVTLTVVDPVAPDATGNVLSILRRSGYNVPGNLTEPGAFSTLGKGNSIDSLGSVIIRALDEDGNFLEEWQLTNAFIVGVTFNDYDYGSEDLVTVGIELRYDWASYVIPERPDDLGPGADVLPRLFTRDNPS